MRASLRVVPLLALTYSVACGQSPGGPPTQLEPILQPQSIASEALFIGISPVDENVVWLAGTAGTFARTVDGGETWAAGIVAGADTLQFRDVHAVDEATAYLLSIGNGQSSRIYKTDDAGATWTLQFENSEADAFFDCMDFWDANNGLAFSDAVDAVFRLIMTDDGGQTWTRIPADRLPPALPGEGSFAASGTCLITVGDSTAMFGTGAGGRASVARTNDRGETWTLSDTPIIQGSSAQGIATLAFRDKLNGLAAGGDISDQEQFADNVAITNDAGRTWQSAPHPTFTGAIYGAAVVTGAPTPTFVVVGPKGASYSTDNAMTWTALDSLEYWSTAFVSPTAGWMIGPNGRITKVVFE